MEAREVQWAMKFPVRSVRLLRPLRLIVLREVQAYKKKGPMKITELRDLKSMSVRDKHLDINFEPIFESRLRLARLTLVRDLQLAKNPWPILVTFVSGLKSMNLRAQQLYINLLPISVMLAMGRRSISVRASQSIKNPSSI